MLRYWTDKERDLLASAETMHELADIALCVLANMEGPAHQVCGPISTGGLGCLNQNTARFRFAVCELDRRGYCVFDQIPFQEKMLEIIPDISPEVSYPVEILDIFYARVFESGHVGQTWFLPGWESSYGTRWERQKTASLGILQVGFPKLWLEPFERIACDCMVCAS